MTRIATIVFGFIFTFLAAAANSQMTRPTPAPELKKLDYFTGTWTSEATISPGPWGPGGIQRYGQNGVDEGRILPRQPFGFLHACGTGRYRHVPRRPGV